MKTRQASSILGGKGFLSVFNHKYTQYSPLTGSICSPYFFTVISQPSSESDPIYSAIRLLFYHLDDQINPIVFHVDRILDKFVPKLFARFMVDLEFGLGTVQEMHSLNSEVSEWTQLMNRLNDLKVLNCELAVKQHAVTLYLSMMQECYIDVGPLYLLEYIQELHRLSQLHQIDMFRFDDWSQIETVLQDKYSDDHYRAFVPRMESGCLEQFLSDYREKSLEEYEGALVAIQQYKFFENRYGGPQMRQLSFGFKQQKHFGDCQELALFELFVNNALYNFTDRTLDTACINSECTLNPELEEILKDADPSMVNCISLRQKWHTFLQGKPWIFQYVNRSIYEPDLDYEVEVCVSNVVAAAEYFFGFELPEFNYIRHKLNLAKLYQVRSEAKGEASHKFSREQFEMFRGAAVRYTLERGFNREKKELQKALTALGTKLSSDLKTFTFELNKQKQNHSLVIMTVDDKLINEQYSVTIDLYGAHVQTFASNRKRREMSQFMVNLFKQ